LVTCDKTTNLKQIFFLWLTSDSSALHMYELVPRFLTRPSFFGLPCERNRDSSVKPPKVRGITGITLLPAGIGTIDAKYEHPKLIRQSATLAAPTLVIAAQSWRKCMQNSFWLSFFQPVTLLDVLMLPWLLKNIRVPRVLQNIN
jgi:hypothetical protein